MFLSGELASSSFHYRNEQAPVSIHNHSVLFNLSLLTINLLPFQSSQTNLLIQIPLPNVIFPPKRYRISVCSNWFPFSNAPREFHKPILNRSISLCNKNNTSYDGYGIRPHGQVGSFRTGLIWRVNVSKPVVTGNTKSCLVTGIGSDRLNHERLLFIYANLLGSVVDVLVLVSWDED